MQYLPYEMRSEEDFKIRLYNASLGFISFSDISNIIATEKKSRNGFDLDKAYAVQFNIAFEEDDKTWSSQYGIEDYGKFAAVPLSIEDLKGGKFILDSLEKDFGLIHPMNA